MGSKHIIYEFDSGTARDKIGEIGSWFREEKGFPIEHDQQTYALGDDSPEVDSSLKYKGKVEELVEDLDNIKRIDTYQIDSFEMSEYIGKALPEGHPLDYELTVVDNFTDAHIVGDKEMVQPADEIMRGEMDKRSTGNPNDPVSWIQDYIDDHIDNLKDDVDDFLDNFYL